MHICNWSKKGANKLYDISEEHWGNLVKATKHEKKKVHCSMMAAIRHRASDNGGNTLEKQVNFFHENASCIPLWCHEQNANFGVGIYVCMCPSI